MSVRTTAVRIRAVMSWSWFPRLRHGSGETTEGRRSHPAGRGEGKACRAWPDERIARSIELTRFPVPDDDDHAETDTEAGLVRAADLIGQLGDPLYPRKLNALGYEFAEIGVKSKAGICQSR